MNGHPLNVIIRGTGAGLAQRVVQNREFESSLDTSDEWITTRTGIRERRFVGPGQTCLGLGLEAARGALADAGMTAAELDLIIFATVTPEYTLPATACFLQAELGARQIPAFDLSAACSGYMYSMLVAARMIHSGAYRNVLIVGAEHLSSLMDFQDRASCVLFGDGAGAAILSATDDPRRGILHSDMGADGERAKLIWVPGGGSREPLSQKVLNERLHMIRMRGREVYKFAVTKMQEVIDDTLRQAGVSIDDIALIVPHQSNLRIIESAREKLGLPHERMLVNIDRYGNTSAASVAICLDEARKTGRVRTGDLILLVVFGAGLTWAAALLRL